MSSRVFQMIVLLIVSAIIALVTNAVRDESIDFIGNWPSVSGSSEIITPPSADEGDPPFISLDEAAAKFQTSGIIFIDARYPEDFEYGHITGSINLPFEELDIYWDEVTPDIPKDRPLIIYCSGEECESSLMLGREMIIQGWTEIYIFYGGWREWEKAGLPVEGSGV